MFLRVARWVPANGVAFVLLVVIASLVKDAPDRDASEAELVSYYQESGNRSEEIVAFFLVGLALFCFLSFLGALRGFLARAEGEPARLTTAAVGSGVAFIALAVAAHVAADSVSWAAEIYDDFEVDPNTARLAQSLWYGFFVMSLFAAAAMTLAASVLALHSHVFPTWLAVVGFLATICGLLGAFVITSLGVLAWILLVSLFMLREEVAPRTRQATSTSPPG
jgi:hypothetical protein